MKKGFFLLLVMALPLAAGSMTAHAAPATEARIAEVQAALDKGDAAHAVQAAGAGLADGGVTDLQRARLLLGRGIARQLLGDGMAALADVTQALNTGALPVEERAQALLQRGFLLDSMDRLAEAAKDYGAVIALKSSALPTALNNRANIFRRQNRLDEARRDYLAALAAGSSRPQYPYYGLGQIAEVRKDAEAARGFYARAVAADPGYGLAAQRLAALGGAPGAVRDAVRDADVVVLKPPAPERIVLKPPPGVVPAAAPARPASGFVAAPPANERIILRPPRRPASFKPAPFKPAPQVPRRASPALRSALDAPVAAASGPQVQLGAWRSRAEAEAGWARFQRQAQGLLDGLSPLVVETDLPGRGRYFRLRTRPPAGRGVTAFCAALSDQGLACFPARD
jgi:tetratricopeptide (TPR) repeat protein